MIDAVNLLTDSKEAKNNKQNILIMAYLEDCSYCHMVRNEILKPMCKNKNYSNLIIRQINGHSFEDLTYFDGRKIDGLQFSSFHRINFYPTVILFNYKGETLEEIVGVANIDYYWHDLDLLLNKHKTI